MKNTIDAKVDIDRENKLLYVSLKEEGHKVATSKRICDSVVLDYDVDGHLIGIELLDW